MGWRKSVDQPLAGELPARQSVICRLAKWIALGMSWLPMNVAMMMLFAIRFRR